MSYDAYTELLGHLCKQAVEDEAITVVIKDGRYAIVAGEPWPELAASGNVRRIGWRELSVDLDL